MWPKSWRRNRSVVRSASVCGVPPASSHDLSLNPAVSITNSSLLPPAHRVAEPRRLGVHRQRPPVGEHLPPVVELLEQDDGDARRLHHLEGQRPREHRVRDAVRQALLARRADAERLLPRVPHVSRPRLERRRAARQVDADVVDVLRADAAVRGHDQIAEHLPDAGEIRTAVGGAWRRCREIWLAVREPRRARRGMAQPLRRQRTEAMRRSPRRPPCARRSRKRARVPAPLTAARPAPWQCGRSIATL